MDNPKAKYGLFDAALMPQVWFNLEDWQLNYMPLYQGDYQQIAEAIPYLIELNEEQNKQAVSALLTQEDYQFGLLLESSDSLSALIPRLAYFYHVRNEQNEPFLRRFFDLRFFNRFVHSLPEPMLLFLFGADTCFYYLDETQLFYHKISLLDTKLKFERVALSYFGNEEKR
ncbi:DUF4123 domain-containing protein [Actinobacillus equuli]|uniref:DUF4123 domain-containing protein n=1 Tax=Actinobacillus equuli TaxID=718 RepID=UPI0024430575|nr:DUF4123 domain-containing protein [Actinobacillus equuli]WGE42557.1 DUF4123 domain-containing protein [Actinobacillus equuli subsp. haemolyticus]WGE76007.1 DUF4123 domain-containing protein [Actinobacillus equuli subsp. haemolyticus]WGE78119.1 DUF4123 domain-containing protein [Actinobacillus equuli subsp. haemolyticus]WGE85912.1 DUF4123 domain-containing protein [Actinobacillus equuli subsp. haemolyticus]